jgi:hypothetical protein
MSAASWIALWREHEGSQFGPQVEHAIIPYEKLFDFCRDLEAAARTAGRVEGLRSGAETIEGIGNFGDYTRDELTDDYGKPIFDATAKYVAALRAEADRIEKGGE